MTESSIQTYTLENKNALRKLAILRSEDRLCDLKFMFPDGVQIQAHKAIVCQYSSVIAARCSDIDQHKLQVLSTEIDSERAINPSIMNIMLDYIYGLSITIRQEYIQDIMRLAIKMNIPEFLADCDKILFESKAISPPDIMINTQNIKQEQTGSGYETGQVSDFEVANQSLETPSTSFDGAILQQEAVDDNDAKPPRRKRKAARAVKANLEKVKQLSEAQLADEGDMMDDPLDDDTDDYEAENLTAVKAEEADSDYDVKATPKKRKRSKATKSPGSSKKSYQKKSPPLDPLHCKECDQKFDAYKDAAEHHKGVHNLIVCDICAKIFDNEADLRRHSVLHSGNPPRILINQAGKAVFQCDVCDKQFTIEPRCLLRNHSFKANSTRDYIEHLKTHHGDRPMICKICGVGKRTMSVYLLHQDMHLGMSIHVCRLCNKSFQHRDSLSNHLNLVHNEEYKEKAQRICEKCGKLCKSRASYMYHKKSAHDEAGPVVCDICNKEFLNSHKLQAHQAYHQKTVLCPECGKQFTYKSKLQRHIRQMHVSKSKPVIPCKICGLMYPDKVALSEHMSVDHVTKTMDSNLNENFYHPTSNFFDNGSIYIEQILILDTKGRLVYHCQHCNEDIQHRESFLKHMKTHDGGKMFTCKICDSNWKNLWYFTGHVYSHSTDSLKYMCNICGKIIKGSQRRLDEHIDSLHGEGQGNRYQCTKCSKSFCRESRLTRHLLSHSEKSHECLICAAKFSLKDNLKSHVALVHNGEKAYRCEACGAGFGYKRSLQSHYLKNPQCADKALIQLPDLNCKICNKSFLSKHALDHHVANLHSERPALFKCTLSPCNKTFKVECDLKKHIRRAHIKPHLCSICGKSFGDKTDLLHHSNIHTGERPYRCETCDKAFANYGSLYKHRQVHTNRPPPHDSFQYTWPISP